MRTDRGKSRYISSADGEHDPRAVRVREVLEACLCRRAAGEPVSDEDICALHPDLMPELADELRTLRVIERARTSRTRPLADAWGGAGVGELTVPPDAFPGYELLREIHRGGQGVIYRAIQESTSRKVALKVLLDGAFAGPLDRARFEREVSVLAALRHPNIVTIHDSGSAAGRFFFVMDYIAGQPLDVYMSSERRSVQDSLRLFLKICHAVNAAHVRGIIHRDLKPANIRVDERGEPYILDFGLARIASGAAASDAGDGPTMTHTGQFVGSLPWAAPEQTDGSPARIDTRSDVYALGVVLYQMLTGKFPYSVVGPVHEVMRRIVSEAPQSPRRLRPEISDELATIVLKCLAKERERRYQTAGEVGRDVDRYLRGEPIEAKRDSAWYMLRKSLQRFRLLLAVASLFVLLLAVSSAVSWSLWRAATQREAEARENLWGALLSQARAVRKSNEMGRRAGVLDAVRQAANIRRNLDLRNEMIAALAMTDARPRAMLPLGEGSGAFDAAFERCAVIGLVENPLNVIRVSDGRILAGIPGLPARTELIQTTVAGQVVVRVFDAPGSSRKLEVWRIGDPSAWLTFDDISPLGNFDISNDGRTLALARADQAVDLFDLVSGAAKRRLPLDRMPARMKFDSSGRQLALYHGQYTQAAILDLLTGDCTSAFDGMAIGWSVSWSPDGTLLAGAEANTVQLWDVEARRPIGALRKHESVITHVEISPDGRRLLSRSWDESTIMWDLVTRQLLFETRGSFVRFSPDGAAIAGWTAVPNSAGLVTRPTIMDLTGDADCRLITSHPDVDALGTNQPAFIFGDSIVLNANIANTRPDRCGLYLIDARTGSQLAEGVVGKYSFPAIDFEGRRLYALLDANQLVYWPVSRANGVQNFGAPTVVWRGQTCLESAPSADGRIIAVTDAPGSVTMISLGEPSSSRKFECSPRTRVVAISSDGRMVAVAAWHDRGLWIWDTQSARCIADVATHELAHAAFSDDGRWLLTADSESLRIWDTTSWELVARAAGDHSCPRFSPDGHYIAAAHGSVVRLYDPNQLTELCTLEPPLRFTTTGLAISADSASLVQMSNRAGIGFLWDLRKIRSQLAVHGLDWAMPPYPPPGTNARLPVKSVHVDLGAPMPLGGG